MSSLPLRNGILRRFAPQNDEKWAGFGRYGHALSSPVSADRRATIPVPIDIIRPGDTTSVRLGDDPFVLSHQSRAHEIELILSDAVCYAKHAVSGDTLRRTIHPSAKASRQWLTNGLLDIDGHGYLSYSAAGLVPSKGLPRLTLAWR
jgi:hypothetical protein